MKSVDVVNQLALLLPNQTDKFTTNVSITSLTRSGTTVTADCAAAHGLIVGKQVNVVGAQTPLVISSLTRAGTVGTLVTTNEHDITENYIENVELSGSIEAEFNGTFTILSVPDRNTITFTMADGGPTTATGSPLLLNGSSALQQYNGLHQVTAIPTPTQFQYEFTDATLYSPTAGTILARTQPRISALASLDYLVDAYTEQAPNDYWAFVILGDVVASKSRKVDSDAVDNLQKGEHYRQQLIQPFSVIVAMPTTAEIQGRLSRDEAETLFRPLCRCLLGSKFDSGLYAGKQNPVNFVDHGTVAFNKTFYLHSYNFQTVSDLTFDDTVGYDLDVAFRDIALSMFLDVGTGEDALTASINLDDVVT